MEKIDWTKPIEFVDPRGPAVSVRTSLWGGRGGAIIEWTSLRTGQRQGRRVDAYGRSATGVWNVRNKAEASQHRDMRIDDLMERPAVPNYAQFFICWPRQQGKTAAAKTMGQIWEDRYKIEKLSVLRNGTCPQAGYDQAIMRRRATRGWRANGLEYIPGCGCPYCESERSIVNNA